MTTLTLGAVYHLPLRQSLGFLRSLLTLMKLTLPAPDFSTLCRRRPKLNIPKSIHEQHSEKARHIVIDSTGLKVYGEGEWSAPGDRQGEKVQVFYDEGLANRIGLEPCAAIRENTREASVEENIGQPLSHESPSQSGCRRGSIIGRQHISARYASAEIILRGLRPWHVWKLLVREPGGLAIGHIPALVRIGKMKVEANDAR